MLLLARLVRTVAMLVAGVIVAGILLFVLGANASNGIVSAVMDAGRFLVGPFDDLFKIDNAKTELAVNWGIAAILYGIAGSLIARLLVALRPSGGRRGFGMRRRRAA
jgi:hypothetical protein